LKKDDSDDKNKSRADWLHGDDCVTCASCLHLDAMEIPLNRKSLRKGNFGIVRTKSKYEVDRSKRMHEESPLHQWCLEKLEEKRQKEKVDVEENKKACELLATNAAFCFLTGGSAKDFIRLNEKDNLTHGLNPATKNDGKQEFFSYREIFFLEITKGIKQFFGAEVKNFSVTLDKITVQF
jgi:hypothetical protein